MSSIRDAPRLTGGDFPVNCEHSLRVCRLWAWCGPQVWRRSLRSTERDGAYRHTFQALDCLFNGSAPAIYFSPSRSAARGMLWRSVWSVRQSHRLALVVPCVSGCKKGDRTEPLTLTRVVNMNAVFRDDFDHFLGGDARASMSVFNNTVVVVTELSVASPTAQGSQTAVE